MKSMLLISMVVSILGSSSAMAQYYNGPPYKGTYSNYAYGAERFYDVYDRYNTLGQ